MLKEIPNRKLPRLKEFDYSNPAYYFITICTKKHQDFFGVVKNGTMFLNEAGNIINTVWTNLKNYFAIELDEYCIMPNHFHGILILKEGQEHSLYTIIGSCLHIPSSIS